MSGDPGGDAGLRILIDSNQWVSSFGLRTGVGAALLYTLDQLDGRILLPEVVEGEIRKNLLAMGLKAVADIDKALRTVQHLTGARPSTRLLSEADFESALTSRLEDLGPRLERSPITLDQTRRALARVDASTSPNRGREQFKDSLIWEAARDTAEEGHRVLFVTDDHAFYEPGHAALAEDLVADCEERGLDITVHRKIGDALASLRESVPRLDYEQIAASVYEALSPQIADRATQFGFDVDELVAGASNVSAFVTENLDQLALTFTLRGTLADETLNDLGVDRRGRFEVTGQGIFYPKESSVTDLDLDGVLITYLHENGERGGHGFAFARGVAGSPRSTPLRIRHKIEAQDG